MKIKNKIELKKTIFICSFIIIIFSIILGLLNYYQYKMYTNNFNKKLDSIILLLSEKYPKIETKEVIQILNANNINKSNILKEYGIDIEKESILMENGNYFKKFLYTNIGISIFFSILLVTVFLLYNKSKDKKLQEITNYIEEINNRNYTLDIDGNTEDELSILKNEIYKTTIMLKEQTENAVNDKFKLKDSLSDISHQLKTPLTSIIIMLDNIIDNPNMENSIRNEFINDIKRQITNINFLVQSLLKLSRFDTNTVNFINKEVKTKDIIQEAINNVSTLCDLKNIEVIVDGDLEGTIICDFKWQVEAVTNILKNAVDYSETSSKIIINCKMNKVYYEIRVIDNGNGIDKEEISHIFERFYKGKNSSKDSVGIGLALAKTIIEKNNGTISVETKNKLGTTFSIKYYT